MSRFRAYIKPRDSQGILTEYIEVTQDIDFGSMGSIDQTIDNDRFQVGLFNFNSFGIKLRNEHGLYSDVTELSSIFRFRRGGCPFKLTWQIEDEFPECGVAICGKAKLSPEVDVLVGVLNDEATTLNLQDQRISFTVLTADAVFDAVETPHASISVSDLYSDTLLLVLNQSEITELLTVDVANINVGLDLAMDVVSEFENTTVKEALDKLLFQSNSVLYIEDETVFIKNRDGGLVSEHTFFGQGSETGIEDVVNIGTISTGLNNVFNFWTWSDTTLKSQDATSISANGIRKKSIEFDEITDSGKRQQVLDEQKTQFSSKKQEFNLTSFVSYETLALGLLARVNVDYPTVYYTATYGGIFPVYGVARYGKAVYPLSETSMTIDVATNFKIMGISILTKEQNIVFKLKEI